jgi:hypothetical protein
MKTELTKEFAKLSDFKFRDVELYRSRDLKDTAIYHTNLKDEERGVVEAFYEVLVFDYDYGLNEIYVRYPNTDYFVETKSKGGGSCGKAKTCEAKNPWVEDFQSTLKIISHDPDMLLSMGEYFHRFNFLTKIASYDKGNPFCSPYPNETFENYNEIEKALSLDYLKLPSDVRSISYCFKTKDETPKYFFIDYPKYSFSYDNHRFLTIENDEVTEYKITKFNRYRDGGTSEISITDDNGVEHEFFSPTSLGGKTKKDTFDGEEIFEVTPEEKEHLINLLGIIVE